MDRADAARRVSALRAKARADGVTAPEKASLEAKAKEIEDKYKLSVVPPISYPRVTSKVKDPKWNERDQYAAWIMGDPEDLIDDDYLWAPDDGDPPPMQYD